MFQIYTPLNIKSVGENYIYRGRTYPHPITFPEYSRLRIYRGSPILFFFVYSVLFLLLWSKKMHTSCQFKCGFCHVPYLARYLHFSMVRCWGTKDALEPGTVFESFKVHGARPSF